MKSMVRSTIGVIGLCGVHLLLQGLGVDQVKDWLGHRNIQNTMVYLRVANLRLDAEKLVNW